MHCMVRKKTTPTQSTRHGMAMLGGYFAIYFAVGFVYPLVSGGDTVLRKLSSNNDDDAKRQDCQQYYESDNSSRK